MTRDPDNLRLEVEEIRRLAQVLQRIKAGEVTDTAGLIQREYLAKGSPGLLA